jgi:hypothetical protein
MLGARNSMLVAVCFFAAVFLVRTPEQVQTTHESPSFLVRDGFACFSLSPAKDGRFRDSLDRSEGRPSAGKDTGSAMEVRFLKEKDDGWSLAETANFRIFHKHDQKTVEQVARVVERSRVSAYAKWIGAEEEDWKPKCYLYLDNAESGGSKLLHGARGYAKRGGLGFSTRRYVRVRAKDAGLLESVLPHEITHAVLFGEFGEQDAPPWAHEGMAGLAQTRADQEQFTDTLLRARRKGELFYVGKLMEMDEYPDDDVALYYAQSVSLVEFLTAERGPRAFIQFLRDAIRKGNEPALRLHYNFENYADLERRWKAYVFGEKARPPQGFASARSAPLTLPSPPLRGRG